MLLSGEDEIRLDFLTADEKVEELQSILKQKEDEIEYTWGDRQNNDQLRMLEQRVEDLEREKKAMQSTLESKQDKIDQLLRSGVVVDESSN